MNAGPPLSGGEADPIPVTPATSGMSASTALVTMHNAASQAGGDALPVLKAFQDYLESERQRARRRMTTLGVVFAVVILAVVAAFALIWYSTMRGMQDTNRQLLDAALKRANAEPPAPVVVQPPPQPSAAETAKVIAEAVSRAQSEQSAVFAKTLEGLNASLEAMRQDNAAMKEKIAQAEAAAKAEAERRAAEKAAAEKAAAEKAARLAAEKAAAEKAAAEKAARLAAEKAAAAKAAAAKTAAAKGTATPASSAGNGAPASGGPGAAPHNAVAPAKPQPPKPAELAIPKYDAPPPPAGFAQDSMGVRLQKEPRPISWRVYVPLHAE